MHDVRSECNTEVCVCVNLSSHKHMNEQTSEFRLPVDEKKRFVCRPTGLSLPAGTGPGLKLIVYNIPKKTKVDFFKFT